MSTIWLTTVVEVHRRIKDTLAKAFSLSVTQYRLLLELVAGQDELSCGELAKLLFVGKPAITQAVDFLYSKGYVKRIVNEDNRRAVLISPTPEGRALLDKADNALSTMLRREAWVKLDTETLNEFIADTVKASIPFTGHTTLKGNVGVEPCYITSGIIQLELYGQLLDSYELSLPEFRVGLYLLDHNGEGSAQMCADELLMRKSSISRTAISLREKGLITSQPSASDLRARILSLTADGRAIISMAFEGMAEIDDKICVRKGGMPPERQNEIVRCISATLRDTFDKPTCAH